MSLNSTPFSIVNDFWYYDTYGSSYQPEPMFNGLVDPNDVCAMEFRVQDEPFSDVRQIKTQERVHSRLDNEQNNHHQLQQQQNVQLGQLDNQHIFELQQLELQHLEMQQLQFNQHEHDRQHHQQIQVAIHQDAMDQQLLIDHQYQDMRRSHLKEQPQQEHQPQKLKQKRIRKQNKRLEQRQRQLRHQQKLHLQQKHQATIDAMSNRTKSYAQRISDKKMTGREKQHELERKERELTEEQARLKASIARLERQTTTMKAILEDLVITSPDYSNQMNHVITTTDIFLDPKLSVSGCGAGTANNVMI